MVDDDKINAVVDSLENNALGDIERACTGGSKMGAFILCSCLIDAIAGFMKGADTYPRDYKRFVCNHLKNYNKDDIYQDLRCKLVHSYSEGGSYMFTDNKKNLHLKKDSSGKIIINLENFIDEIKKALEDYKNVLLNKANTRERQKAIKRYDDNGIIRVGTVNIQNKTQFDSTITQSTSGSSKEIA